MNLLGLHADPSKIETISKHNTFCNLCQRKVHRDESVYTWPGSKFVVHPNCNDPEVRTRMHLYQFRKEAKNKGNARKGKSKNNKDNRKLTPAQNPQRGVPVSHGRGWRDVR